MYDTWRLPITSSWHNRCPPAACTLHAQSVWSDSSPQPALVGVGWEGGMMGEGRPGAQPVSPHASCPYLLTSLQHPPQVLAGPCCLTTHP